MPARLGVGRGRCILRSMRHDPNETDAARSTTISDDRFPGYDGMALAILRRYVTSESEPAERRRVDLTRERAAALLQKLSPTGLGLDFGIDVAPELPHFLPDTTSCAFPLDQHPNLLCRRRPDGSRRNSALHFFPRSPEGRDFRRARRRPLCRWQEAPRFSAGDIELQPDRC